MNSFCFLNDLFLQNNYTLPLKETFYFADPSNTDSNVVKVLFIIGSKSAATLWASVCIIWLALIQIHAVCCLSALPALQTCWAWHQTTWSFFIHTDLLPLRRSKWDFSVQGVFFSPIESPLTCRESCVCIHLRILTKNIIYLRFSFHIKVALTKNPPSLLHPPQLPRSPSSAAVMQNVDLKSIDLGLGSCLSTSPPLPGVCRWGLFAGTHSLCSSICCSAMWWMDEGPIGFKVGVLVGLSAPLSVNPLDDLNV